MRILMEFLFKLTANLLSGTGEAVPVLRTPPVVKRIIHEWSKRPHAKVLGGVCTAGVAMLALMFSFFMADALVLGSGMLMAFAAVATPKDLKTILKEMKELQDEYTGQHMPEDVGERFEALAAEAKALQDEQDRKNRIRELEQGARKPVNPALPDEGKQDPDEVVGYLKLGEAFTNSPEYKRLAAAGFPQTAQTMVSFNGGSFHIGPQGAKLRDGALVPVTRKMVESKAVPTIGAGVIQTDRIGDVVRFEERRQLRIRDLLNVSPTTSNSIEYTTIDAFTEAAAPVAESGLKPESTMEFGTATAPVRTIAVWMPVTEQQLQDVPQLQNMINVELSWDLGRVEERQLVWGDGTGQNLLGIFETPGVAATRSGGTIIDQARKAMTDVAVAGLQANGIAMHPFDWEAAQLEKGSDNHYIWAVVTTENGNRLWGLNVVETLAMERPYFVTGTNTIRERRLLVGDFQRGATLWDRQQAGIQVGYINDQFVRNQRTIRAEERLAFAVKRPAGFKYSVTQAEAA